MSGGPAEENLPLEAMRATAPFKGEQMCSNLQQQSCQRSQEAQAHLTYLAISGSIGVSECVCRQKRGKRPAPEHLSRTPFSLEYLSAQSLAPAPSKPPPQNHHSHWASIWQCLRAQMWPPGLWGLPSFGARKTAAECAWLHQGPAHSPRERPSRGLSLPA